VTKRVNGGYNGLADRQTQFSKASKIFTSEGVSAKPVTPVKPTTPAKPSTPEKPSTPTKPSTPEKPSTPVKPTPTKPSNGSTPAKPSNSTTPAKPVPPPVKPTPTPSTPGQKTYTVTAEQMQKFGWKPQTDVQMKDLNAALAKYEINTPARVKNFMA
jgi:outer membrane biosynthesis protein TonB